MIAKKLLNNIQKRGVYTINQNDYVGISPVQIVNNTISLETSFIDKANSVDRLQRSIDRNTTNITTNTNSINSINNSINGISTQLTTLNNSINTTNNNVATNTQNIQTNTNNIATNTQQIEAVKTKAETNESRIDTLNTNVATKLDTATYNQEKTNFAKTNEANTFVGKNTFKNTGDIVSIQRTDNSSFGIDFKKENGDRVAFVGTSASETNKATVWGVNGLKLQTTNSNIKMISGSGDLQWESNRNWSQNLDNTITRTKDFKYVRKFEKTSGITQPGTSWNTNWSWTLNGINTQGLHEFLIIVSISNVAYSLNGKVVWKNGLSESKSQFITISDGSNEYMFQLVIKTSNVFCIYHKKTGGSGTIQWIRGWILRDNNLPWKMNQIW